MLHGCTSVLQEARRRAAPGTLTVLFAPRVESWAVQQQAETNGVDGEACSLGASPPPLQGMQPLAMQLPHRSVGRCRPPVAQACLLPCSLARSPVNVKRALCLAAVQHVHRPGRVHCRASWTCSRQQVLKRPPRSSPSGGGGRSHCCLAQLTMLVGAAIALRQLPVHQRRPRPGPSWSTHCAAGRKALLSCCWRPAMCRSAHCLRSSADALPAEADRCAGLQEMCGLAGRNEVR